MAQDNEALLRRWFEEVWNQASVAAIDELFAPEAVAHGLGPGGSDVKGTEGFKWFHAQFGGAFPDLHIQVEDVLCRGDRAAARFTAAGTHLGDGLGVPPTGRRVATTGMAFTRWENGRIVEGWNNVDLASLFHQIGHLELLGHKTG